MFRGRPPPTSLGCPLKILFDHPGDVSIWRPGNVRKWRTEDVLVWCPRNVPGRLIRDVARTFPGRRLDDLQNTSLRQCVVICWMSLIFLLLFLWNFFDWPNLHKNNSILKAYLQPNRTSKMEVFSEIREWPLSVNCFRERASS